MDFSSGARVALLSLPEGDDKVLKYPSLFHRADILQISKVDLAPHLTFDIGKEVNECRSLNRAVVPFRVSAVTGEGMDSFRDFLADKTGIGF